MMIRNISYRDRDLNLEIQAAVGKAYGLLEIFRMGGIGSPRMQVVDASPALMNYLSKIGKGEFCNIEIRPGGIIVRFRYHLDSMAWIIPYHKLSLVGSGESYTLHSEGEYLRVIGANAQVILDSFFRKLQAHKARAFL